MSSRSDLEVRDLDQVAPASSLGRVWESLVQSHATSGFMQSLHWAEVKRKQGLSALHLGVFKDDQLIGGAHFYSSMRRSGAGILVAPEGPVLPWDDESTSREALGLMIGAIQARSIELGIMSMRVEARMKPPIPPMLREFGRAPVDLVPRETLYIDLAPPPDAILAAMKPKGRYNIKIAQRSGVEVTKDNSADCVKRFYDVLTEASERDHFAIESRRFFEHLADVLIPSGNAQFFFAGHDGDRLGALLLITYGTRATYLYGGISDEKRNLMGGYALQWTAMNAAREAGATTYDFYGFDPYRSPEHNYARFSQFKGQFGGQVMRFIGAQEYFFLDNVADSFIKVVNEAKATTSAGRRDTDE